MPEPECGYFKYVPWERVEAYLARGWSLIGACPGHHGFYSALMFREELE